MTVILASHPGAGLAHLGLMEIILCLEIDLQLDVVCNDLGLKLGYCPLLGGLL